VSWKRNNVIIQHHYFGEITMSIPQMGEFCWNELATTSVSKSKAFYGELLGWKFIEHDVGDKTYTMIQNKDDTLGGIYEIPSDLKEKVSPQWTGYILVENVVETLAKAIELGATQRMPVTKVGEMGLFAIVSDTTGANIAFWQACQ
jgi:predicted enzyme related to lactoylglutathione lyase